ncbi:MAG: hypothetical protein ACYTE8_01075, partial [Planctomycetota bacterium]
EGSAPIIKKKGYKERIEEPQKKPTKKQSKKKPNVPCPIDLIQAADNNKIPEKYLAWAIKKEVKQDIAKRQFGRFVRHHISKGSKWADWYRAWQNWLDNHIDWQKPPKIQGTDPTAPGYDPGAYETIRILRNDGATNEELRKMGYQV